jgi:hypothetical protein
MMASIVYALCALTCVACAALLLRGYRRSRVKLLLWSGLCFSLLALENAILFVDLVIVPEIDLSVSRNAIGLLGLALLIYGLIGEQT